MYQYPTHWFLSVLSLKMVLEKSISPDLAKFNETLLVRPFDETFRSMRSFVNEASMRSFITTVAFSVLEEKSPKQITKLFSLKFDDSMPIRFLFHFNLNDKSNAYFATHKIY